MWSNCWISKQVVCFSYLLVSNSASTGFINIWLFYLRIWGSIQSGKTKKKKNAVSDYVNIFMFSYNSRSENQKWRDDAVIDFEISEFTGFRLDSYLNPYCLLMFSFSSVQTRWFPTHHHLSSTHTHTHTSKIKPVVYQARESRTESHSGFQRLFEVPTQMFLPPFFILCRGFLPLLFSPVLDWQCDTSFSYPPTFTHPSISIVTITEIKFLTGTSLAESFWNRKRRNGDVAPEMFG